MKPALRVVVIWLITLGIRNLKVRTETVYPTIVRQQFIALVLMGKGVDRLP